MKTSHMTSTAALLLVSLAGLSSVAAITDTDILNFALNLEYLEAEFYNCAVTGSGLPATLTGGGPASIGCQKANLTGDVLSIVTEIAKDEYNHVAFLRTALGAAAVPMPLLNIGTGANGSFSIAANAAFNMTLDPPFTPYANNLFFIHGAFIFEDVGVTAYQGAAALITTPAYLTAAAGILATEAYHAGSIREQLIQNSSYTVSAYGVEVNQIVGAISALRATLSGTADDQGILINGMNNLTPVDNSSITFARSTNQVINIVTAAGPNGMGLFYPNGLNGVINGSSASAAALSTDIAGRRKLHELEAASATSSRKLLANITDADILIFALNLEYLEAEYYSWATKGYGIPVQYRGSSNNPSTNAHRANLSAPINSLGSEIAADELNHVIFLRTALGAAAPDKPAIDFSAFGAAANAAFGTTLSPTIDVFSNDITFLLGAFLFEDVGVTAYKGAAALITNKAYLTPAAGILAVEAYHAGAVRTLLYQNATQVIEPYNVTIGAAVAAISKLRAKASGAYDDVGITTSTGAAIIAAGDSNSIAFSRTPAQVVSIAVLGTQNGTGGFFPDGLSGPINGTASSAGAVDTVPALPAMAPASASAPGGSAATGPSSSTGPSSATGPSSSGSGSGSTTGTPASGASTPSSSASPSTAPAPAPSSASASAASAVALVAGVASMLAVLV